MAPSSRDQTTVIIVGGAGTIEISTALHLVRAGYAPSHINVLDTYPVPSAHSAGNDLNKIMGIRLANPEDKQLSLEALNMWRRDELFKPFFHNTGQRKADAVLFWLDCSGSEKGIASLKEAYRKLVDAGLGETHKWLDSEDEIIDKAPRLHADNIKGWKAIWSEDSGWLAASEAIKAVGEYLRLKGVNFAFGGAGSFQEPLLKDGRCIGVETVDGTKYYADKVVLAAGAWSPVLVDLEGQCVSKAWVWAHIQLTAEEATSYKSHPVVYNADYGFFFEPNEKGIIKVCDEFPGFTRFKLHPPCGASTPQQVSIPRSHAKHPTDTIPDASRATIAKAVQTFLPQFADRELINQQLCWCTDTADAALLVCEHPRWKNFILATGDSGHSFKLLPNIGKHVVELMEGTLSEELEYAWSWRPGIGDPLKSRRAAHAKDLADMPGWRHDGEDSDLLGHR